MINESLFDSKKYNDLDAFTKIAINQFQSVCKHEVLLEKEKRKLSYYSKRIPDKDMEEYVNITNQLEKKMQNKIANFKDEMR